MSREKITRRQKDISRLLREKRRIHPDKIKKPERKNRPNRGGIMPETSFSDAEIRQLTAHGLSESLVLDQLDRFKKGAAPVQLNRPCTVGDGIFAFAGTERNALVERHDHDARRKRIMKFVPASGAASRMFREWFRCLDGGGFDRTTAARAFASDIRRYAFYDDLEKVAHRQGENLASWLEQERYSDILESILTERGLKYGTLPKALLKFHAYPEGSRTALEEHLVEAALYAVDHERVCRIHFTVSKEHRSEIEKFLNRIRGAYEEKYEVRFEIDLSVQSASTDTIAVDMENRPFRDEAGKLVLRPGGHGALLTNINNIKNVDILFIKNIDNIVPDRLKPLTVLHKKMLSGCLITLQQQVFRELTYLAEGSIDERRLKEMAAFCRTSLNIDLPVWIDNLTLEERKSILFAKMNRPIRVCGMVRNEGEPGGGPFWINESHGACSLQIVEESQIDHHSTRQVAIWSAATHFNPVDLVCGVRDYLGRKFDLQSFIDQNAFNIAVKSEKGRDLRALELPGLWNGAMASWITVFVETPIETFNPVKTVNDLLRPQHQGNRFQA